MRCQGERDFVTESSWKRHLVLAGRDSGGLAGTRRPGEKSRQQKLRKPMEMRPVWSFMWEDASALRTGWTGDGWLEAGCAVRCSRNLGRRRHPSKGESPGHGGHHCQEKMDENPCTVVCGTGVGREIRS